VRIAIDSNVLVASVLSWHEHHRAALSAVEAAVEGPDELVVVGHTLAEAYSVMTRLPAPHRVRPEDAVALLEGVVDAATAILGLSGRDTWRTVRALPDVPASGGRTYDALIAATARRGGARRLLTFNVEHFESFADPGILDIASPVER
jgi:predicted nucleic acid-binding protein